jgi:predicted AAA+ superfamily ATPase
LIEIKNKSIKNKTNYVFLDEVQEINEFEKTIISLFEDKNVKYDIYITGSNSSMFSKEMISLFTGRTVEIYVSPFSYNEILKHNLFNTSDKGLPYHQNSPLNEYILKGGLGINIQDYQKDNFVYKNLEIVVDGTITKDIKNRHKLRHIDGIEKVIRYIFINIGRIVNANNLENFLKSNKEIVISKKTLLNYFR